MSRLRVALVGCGRISRKHFEAYQKHASDIELVALCDVDRGALDPLVEREKVKGFESYSELLALGKFDLVAMTTLSDLRLVAARMLR